MKKAVPALVAAVLGGVLLLGGAGSLAFWSDSTETGPQRIEAGTLALGRIGTTDISATIKQRIPGRADSLPVPYTGTALTPGDVITATVDVPVTMNGQALTAEFAVVDLDVVPASAAAADTALAALITGHVRVLSLDGQPTSSAPQIVLTHVAGTPVKKKVRVVVEVELPWGTPGDADPAAGGAIVLQPAYTLTQKLPQS